MNALGTANGQCNCRFTESDVCGNGFYNSSTEDALRNFDLRSLSAMDT